MRTGRDSCVVGMNKSEIPGLEMLRFQISAQKTFPKVMLSAAGPGSLEKA